MDPCRCVIHLTGKFIQISCAGTECIHLDSHVLQHRHEQITKRVVFFAIKGKMLTMTQPTSSEQDGKIRGVMNVRITEVAAIQDHGLVQQSSITLGLGSQVSDESTQLPEVFASCRFQLTQLFPVLAMMA